MRYGEVKQNQRLGQRMKAVLPVRVRGVDAEGALFDELAHTLDLTSAGARLGAVRRELNVLDEVTISYKQRRIPFRVIWTKKLTGTSEFQVGLMAIASDREAWGFSLPTVERTVSQASAVA